MGFNQEERKAFQEFCTKAGQWERNFGKDESPALARVGLPKLPYASESPARLFKTDSWRKENKTTTTTDSWAPCLVCGSLGDGGLRIYMSNKFLSYADGSWFRTPTPLG